MPRKALIHPRLVLRRNLSQYYSAIFPICDVLLLRQPFLGTACQSLPFPPQIVCFCLTQKLYEIYSTRDFCPQLLPRLRLGYSAIIRTSPSRRGQVGVPRVQHIVNPTERIATFIQRGRDRNLIVLHRGHPSPLDLKASSIRSATKKLVNFLRLSRKNYVFSCVLRKYVHRRTFLVHLTRNTYAANPSCGKKYLRGREIRL